MNKNAPIPAALSLDGLGNDARAAFDLAADSGYSGIAIPTNHPQLNPENLSDTAARHVLRTLASKSLTADSIRIAAPKSGLTDPATIDRTLDNAHHAIAIARSLGVHTLSLNIGNLTGSKVAESTLISALRELAQQADAAGLTLALGADVSTQLAGILKAVDYDRARLLLDGTRLIAANENPLAIASDYAGSIGQFTAADAVRAGNSLRSVELGQGQLPLAELLRLLKEQDFRGPTVVDVRDFASSAPSAARHAADAIRHALQK